MEESARGGALGKFRSNSFLDMERERARARILGEGIITMAMCLRVIRMDTNCTMVGIREIVDREYERSTGNRSRSRRRRPLSLTTLHAYTLGQWAGEGW